MSRRLHDEISDDTLLPLRLAGMLVDKSRSTVYAWAESGLLQPVETVDGLQVTAGEVRTAAAKVRPPGRRRAARATNTPD